MLNGVPNSCITKKTQIHSLYPQKQYNFKKSSVYALRIMTMAARERSGTIGQITKKDAEGRFS